MSYGRESFAENVALVGRDPMSDPQNFNLNEGLGQFAMHVQADLNRIEQKLDQVLRLLQQRR